jgi:hypothetical protein
MRIKCKSMLVPWGLGRTSKNSQFRASRIEKAVRGAVNSPGGNTEVCEVLKFVASPKGLLLYPKCKIVFKFHCSHFEFYQNSTTKNPVLIL